MTITDEQAREWALRSLRELWEQSRQDHDAHGAARELENFITQSAENARIAEAVKRVVTQTRYEIEQDKGWDYTEYERGRLEEKRRCLSVLTASVLGGEEPVCTCPSGDGSLRWPCPRHPPNAATDNTRDGGEE